MGEVRLSRNAREPHIGDVLRWDGQGWVPDVVQSRWSVIQAANSPMAASVREGPGIDVLRRAGGLQVGMGGDTVLLYDAGGSPVAEYLATGAGLADAVAAAGSGDTILLPSRSISITAALTMAAGVTVAGMGLSRSVLAFSGFSGTALTMGENCVCQMFTLTMVATGTTGIGIDATAGGVFVDTVRATASGGTVENTGILAGGGQTMDIAQYSIVNENHGANSWAVGAWGAAPQCFEVTTHVDQFGDWARSNFIWSADVQGAILNDLGTVAVRLLCESLVGDQVGAKVMTASSIDGSATPDLTGGSTETDYTTGDIIAITGSTTPYPGDGTSYFRITLMPPNSAGDYAASFRILDVWYEQGDGVWLLYDDNEPILFNCIVDAYGVDAVGVQVVGDARARLYHCQLSGKTYDIQALSGGLALVCGCQYSHDNVDGDIVQEPGDRATFEVGTQHADDIEAGTMTRHLPAPGTAGKLAIDQGTVWESKAISGGLTLAETGVVTLGGADELSDVDTATDPPDKSEVLKWNGSDWVPATYDYNFTFSIASFSDGEATTQLIGTGVWEADEAVIFAATYNNGPPTSADVLMSINGAGYNDVGNMDSPAYTAGKNYDGAINYPAAKDQYLRFRLDATDGADPDIEYETAIYFRNHIRWGVANKNAGFTEADVEGLANSAISNDQTRSMSLNAGVGEYLVFAFPSSYTSIPDGDDYEDDGGTGFIFNSLACAFKAPETVSITNTAGYTENYKVYASESANLGNHTLVTTTSNSQINPLYYGKTVKTDTFTEADIEGLGTNEITNDNTQVWDSVTTGSGEYMLFAFPKRLGIPTFWVGGFEGGFEAPETVSVTNSNGWTEDYYAWRSTNSNLGATVVTTA